MAIWTAFEGTLRNSVGKEEKFGLFLDASKVKVIRRCGNTLFIHTDDSDIIHIDFIGEDDLNNTFRKLSEAIAGKIAR